MITNIKPNHVMPDLETMGTRPGCAIVSIGAVVFDPRYGVENQKSFYRELDWKSQVALGFHIDPSTEKWWSKQSKEAREGLNGIDDLKTVLIEFAKFIPSKDAKIWGNGPSFDVSILEHAYTKLGLDIPWKFWNVRDCRTVKDMFECQRGGWNNKVAGTAHNALDDAKHQAQYVTMMWGKLAGRKNV